MEIDALDRILIPDYLKEFAGLKEKAVITGLYKNWRYGTKRIGMITKPGWKAKPILWRKSWENWALIKNTMHIPVLLKESTELLNPKIGDTILDATINGGDYAEEILKMIGEKGRLIGIDQDDEVLNKLREKWKDRKNILLARDNFRNLDKVLASLKIEKINGAIFDIGVSSSQIDESGRGFSFQKDEPLLMTMKAEIEPDDLTPKKS